MFWKLLDLDLSVNERASAASIRTESAKQTQRKSSIGTALSEGAHLDLLRGKIAFL